MITTTEYVFVQIPPNPQFLPIYEEDQKNGVMLIDARTPESLLVEEENKINSIEKLSIESKYLLHLLLNEKPPELKKPSILSIKKFLKNLGWKSTTINKVVNETSIYVNNFNN